MSLQLTAILNGEQRIWPLAAETLTIGRASRHTIHLTDTTVSKDHAEIVRRGDAWSVRDLGSRNGTRVNGVEASPSGLPLREGDTVEIGKVMLNVTRRAESPPKLSTAEAMSSSVRLKVQDVLAGSTTRTRSDSGRLVQILAEAGRMLVLPRPLAETCDVILAVVEKAIPATRLLILMREREGEEPLQVAARSLGGSLRRPLGMSRTIMDTVLNDCTAVVTRDAQADERFKAHHSIILQSVHSAMAVPLFDNERVLGLMYADSIDPRVTFDQEQLEIFTLLANMAAVKITNARLLEDEEKRRRMAQELATARGIQQSLLPPAPQIEGLDCHAALETCFEVGGDLYDFHLDRSGRLLFMVGDVSGKGMGAALLMSSTLSSARVLYEVSEDPVELITRLNAVVHRNTDAGRFVTLFFGRLDVATGELQYVNGGHNPPVLVHGNELHELEATGIPLGMLSDFPYTAGTTKLAPGDLLAVYTDGIPEAERAASGEGTESEFFGDDRFRQSLLESAGAPHLEQTARRVLDEIERFVAGTPRSDDVTLLLLRCAPKIADGSGTRQEGQSG
jgi:serine phosphatase RsbU (regulator of sigma subunit)